MGLMSRVQILIETAYVFVCVKALKKDMNPFRLPVAIVKIVGQSELSNFSRQVRLERKTLNSKPGECCCCNIHLDYSTQANIKKITVHDW